MNLTGKYKKIFLIVLSFLYILLTVLLITAVAGIYREGIAAKAVDPLQWIYSESRIAESLLPILPLFFLTVGASVVGLIKGIKDEKGLFIRARAEKGLFIDAKEEKKPFMSTRDEECLLMSVKDEKGLNPVKSDKIQHPGTSAGEITPRKSQQNALQKALRKILLIIAIILIVAGVYNGSAMDVFGKAVKICTECVGIG